MLTTGMTTQIREQVERTLTQTATIRHQTLEATAANSYGNDSYETTVLDEDVACRVAPLGGTPYDRMVGEQMQAESLWRITFPAGAEVPDDAEIVIDGETYEVVSALGPRTNEFARRVTARKRGAW